MKPNILIPHSLPPVTHVTSFILSVCSEDIAFLAVFIKVFNDLQHTSCYTFIDPSRYCIHAENLVFVSSGYCDFCCILCSQEVQGLKNMKVFFAHTQRKF